MYTIIILRLLTWCLEVSPIVTRMGRVGGVMRPAVHRLHGCVRVNSKLWREVDCKARGRHGVTSSMAEGVG